MSNLINKNLIIYTIKNLNTQKNYLLILTLKLGWLLLPLRINKNLQLNKIIFGYNRLYKFFFKLKGFGYKWKYCPQLNNKKQIIQLKIGYTHRVTIILKNNCKSKLKRRRLILKHRCYTYLRNNLNLLFFLYKTYLYNKKGIYLRGTKFKLKISKKKSKF